MQFLLKYITILERESKRNEAKRLTERWNKIKAYNKICGKEWTFFFFFLRYTFFFFFFFLMSFSRKWCCCCFFFICFVFFFSPLLKCTFLCNWGVRCVLSLFTQSSCIWIVMSSSGMIGNDSSCSHAIFVIVV